MSNPKIIAFYLPQYHPTPDNDKWWGKGFTEWTNVGKAKPLFPGHYQPKVPADLGYYDLRLPEVREAQAELAKEAGIYGFCYYHYWFGNGKQELELPFNEVLRLGKPDFPFMLCWANESWHRKFWNKDGKGTSKEILVEQTYPEGDIEKHFYHLLPAFRDSRYIKIDGKPAFMIYKPLEFKGIEKFIKIWNELALKEGLKGIFFIGYLWQDINQSSIDSYNRIGFNATSTLGFWDALWQSQNIISQINTFIRKYIPHIPHIWPSTVDYRRFTEKVFTRYDSAENVFPTIIPNWDHSPRSGKGGIVVKHSTPQTFKRQLQKLLQITKGKDNNIVFLKSWNEWGEGNYVEPDLKYGKGYLEVIQEVISQEENH